MKCILLAVDDRPIKGFNKAPYTMDTMGLPLFAYGIKAVQNAGFPANCLIAKGVEDQLSQGHASALKDFPVSVYSGDLKALDLEENEIVLILDAAVFYLSEALFSRFKTRSLSVGKEPVSYLLGERTAALLVRADLLKKVWSKASPDPKGRRFMTQLTLALQDAVESTYDDTLSDTDALVVDQLYAHHLACEHVRRNKLMQLMAEGVQVRDLQGTFIDETVTIEEGSIIQPNTVIMGTTKIGPACVIGPGARIGNCQIGRGVSVKDSTLDDSVVEDDSTIGPYAYLRPGSHIGKHVKIGDFVEVKNAKIGDYSKVSHLSYIGDGSVGKNVNIGCGVVFVNYDGEKKHLTTVEDNAFIGCNANLVAPVTVKSGAYVAAGSTITEDVASDSLAIARSRQTQKLNWVIDKKKND